MISSVLCLALGFFLGWLVTFAGLQKNLDFTVSANLEYQNEIEELRYTLERIRNMANIDNE